MIFLSQVNSLRVCRPQVDALIYCKRLKCPILFIKNLANGSNDDFREHSAKLRLQWNKLFSEKNFNLVDIFVDCLRQAVAAASEEVIIQSDQSPLIRHGHLT